MAQTNVVTNAFLRSDARGHLRLIKEEALNDSDKLLTVPAGKIWRVLWIYATLAATATVGSRWVYVRYHDSDNNVIYQAEPSATLPASTTRRHRFIPGGFVPGAQNNEFWTPLPIESVLPAGYDIRIYDVNAVDAAADDLDIQMMVWEYTV